MLAREKKPMETYTVLTRVVVENHKGEVENKPIVVMKAYDSSPDMEKLYCNHYFRKTLPNVRLHSYASDSCTNEGKETSG